MTINITSLNTNKKEIKGKENIFQIASLMKCSFFFTFSFTMMAQVIYSVSMYQLLGNYHCYQQTLFIGTGSTFSK